MEESRKAGLLGEVYAARYLREQGYQILAANYRVKGGELDLVAERDGIVVFAEVKTRRAGALFAPAEAVDEGKRERVRSAAAAFLAAERIEERLRLQGRKPHRKALARRKPQIQSPALRFDIIEVELAGADYRVNHIENAF